MVAVREIGVAALGTLALLSVAACTDLPFVGPQPVVPANGGGGVAGYIRDEQGRPAAGAFVVASCEITDVQVTANADGWYDLGTAGLRPGPCSIKGGTDQGKGFFADVVVLAGQSVRRDFVARG